MVWASASGAVWTVAGLEGPASERLLRVDPSDISTADAGPAGAALNGLIELDGSRLLLRGSDTGDPSSRVDTVGPHSDRSSTTSGAPIGLRHGVREAVAIGRALVLADWSGSSPEGRSLAVMDRRTLEASGSIAVDGVPCAIAATGRWLLAVDRSGGRLLVVDPETRMTVGSVHLGVRDLAYSQVVVVPAATVSGG